MAGHRGLTADSVGTLIMNPSCVTFSGAIDAEDRPACSGPHRIGERKFVQRRTQMAGPTRGKNVKK
jgi:hypothetical protein